MSFRIDLSQLAGLQATVAQFGEKVQKDVAMAGAAAMAKVVYDEARLNASRNRKTGLLQSAIYRAYSPEKSDGTLKLYRVSWNKRKAPHGHLIEFGTSRAPAYPFLRPAVSQLPEAVQQARAKMAEKLLELEQP
ncbi:hypothetical protein ASC94_10110 [Massilia sp. Root418]|uniref:HK97-gp10 family putative phage morphogenesis protein n=1 Tax=Massilia sp. Root418 TaxID=1736532 RepID=UPI0007022EB1|nr:HK97-gp10 family putative phage morphogenesis protein [Massilia sp. Root418]KQW97135.1 hypothetical protein ASC94_10110 [Massilia sp. Root418]